MKSFVLRFSDVELKEIMETLDNMRYYLKKDGFHEENTNEVRSKRLLDLMNKITTKTGVSN